MQQFMRDDFYVRKFGNKDAALLGSQELRHFLVTQMSNRLANTTSLRFILLSAHDTTLTMLLTALGLPQQEAPPFASTLFFELWSVRDPKTKL
jgi:hypothetical protein